MAAVRVTKLRLADSLQQGVVWFSTYEGMRAAMAIYDEKAAEVVAAKELAFGFTVDGADAAVGTGADEAAEMDAVDGGLEGVGAAAAAQGGGRRGVAATRARGGSRGGTGGRRGASGCARPAAFGFAALSPAKGARLGSPPRRRGVRERGGEERRTRRGETRGQDGAIDDDRNDGLI